MENKPSDIAVETEIRESRFLYDVVKRALWRDGGTGHQIFRKNNAENVRDIQFFPMMILEKAAAIQLTI